ncbi:hypothetical protein C8T65DRAFT_838192 [Cerioporus squamosus]|nr:hypothetical protein C8T65DRAFT_838192 [Cerioporus squamosus]
MDDTTLLPFFTGATACFSLTRLQVVSCAPSDGDTRGWSPLYQHSPRVTELTLDVCDSSDALAALSPADSLEHLERLAVVKHAHRGPDAEIEAMASMLEKRVSRRMRLRSLSFTQQVDSDEVGWCPALTGDEVARLKAAVHALSVERVIIP